MMKKIFLSLSYLLLLLFILVDLSGTAIRNECLYNVIESKREETNIVLPEGYYRIPTNSYFDNVYSETIPNESIDIASVKMDKCVLINDSLDYIGGDIIPEGFVDGGITYLSRIRVNKYENSLLLGDLIDTTFVEFTLTGFSFPIDISSLELSATFFEKRVTITDYNISYVDGFYQIKAFIKNNGLIFSNQYISLTSKYNSLPIDGLYVKKEAVQYDDEGTYIKQIIYYHKQQYFKKTRINIESEMGWYYKITSDSHITDCLICY